MNGKFSQVPVEDDTTILERTEIKLGGMDVLHEKWFWEEFSIWGESFIFTADDVKDMQEGEIRQLVLSSPLVGGEPLTFSRTDSFVFVNFNFIAYDDLLLSCLKHRNNPEMLTPEEQRKRKEQVARWIGESNRRQIRMLRDRNKP